MLVLGFEEFELQAKALAEQLNCPYKPVEVHRFPDGEALVKIPPIVPAHVVFCRSLNDPDQKLIELILACETARTLGAEKITLAAPYLCYLRQDKAFKPGEAVSQQIVGKLIADYLDEIVTVDAHLHRVTHLQLAVPCKHAVNLSAVPFMVRFLSDNLENPFLIGPDRESEQWVSALARARQLDYAVCHKQRLGDRRVHVAVPESANVANREVVIVDDMVTTGHTLAEAARALVTAGAARVHCLVTHPLFVEGAEKLLHDAGVSNIWSTDSITHPSNVIALAPLLSQALRGA